MSSSPPPMDGPGSFSPSKPARSSQVAQSAAPSSSSASREEQNRNAKKVNGAMSGGGVVGGGEDDEDGGMGGFDLARGFQPIGSFHSHTSGSFGSKANAGAARAA